MKILSVNFSVLLAVLGLLCSSALAQKYDYYTEPGTDFSKFKTYKWHRAEKAVYPAEDLDQMFIRTIEAELTKKGLSRIETEDADLYVIYQIAVVDDMQWSSSATIIPWGSLAGVNYGIVGATVNSTNAIQKGSLILDVYDVKQKTRVWQAHVTKTLAQTTDIRKRENNTKKIMAKIFQSYPLKGK